MVICNSGVQMLMLYSRSLTFVTLAVSWIVCVWLVQPSSILKFTENQLLLGTAELIRNMNTMRTIHYNVYHTLIHDTHGLCVLHGTSHIQSGNCGSIVAGVISIAKTIIIKEKILYIWHSNRLPNIIFSEPQVYHSCLHIHNCMQKKYLNLFLQKTY